MLSGAKNKSKFHPQTFHHFLTFRSWPNSFQARQTIPRKGDETKRDAKDKQERKKEKKRRNKETPKDKTRKKNISKGKLEKREKDVLMINKHN